jgi:hypothetical protein
MCTREVAERSCSSLCGFDIRRTDHEVEYTGTYVDILPDTHIVSGYSPEKGEFLLDVLHEN